MSHPKVPPNLPKGWTIHVDGLNSEFVTLCYHEVDIHHSIMDRFVIAAVMVLCWLNEQKRIIGLHFKDPLKTDWDAVGRLPEYRAAVDGVIEWRAWSEEK